MQQILLLLSRRETAAYLRISVRTLDRLTAQGKLHYISACPRGRKYYMRTELDRYIKQHTH